MRRRAVVALRLHFANTDGAALRQETRSSMSERKRGIVDTVKETGASLSQAVTSAVEAATDYLRPTTRKPGAKKNRTLTVRTRSHAAAAPRRKTSTAKRSHAAVSTKRPTSAPGRETSAKSRAATKGKTAAQGKR